MVFFYGSRNMVCLLSTVLSHVTLFGISAFFCSFSSDHSLFMVCGLYILHLFCIYQHFSLSMYMDNNLSVLPRCRMMSRMFGLTGFNMGVTLRHRYLRISSLYIRCGHLVYHLFVFSSPLILHIAGMLSASILFCESARDRISCRFSKTLSSFMVTGVVFWF